MQDATVLILKLDLAWYGLGYGLAWHSFQYNLPNPLTLLHQPPSQKKYKSLIKNNIAQLRAMIHRGEPNELTSLQFGKAEYMSVLRPDPMPLPTPRI